MARHQRARNMALSISQKRRTTAGSTIVASPAVFWWRKMADMDVAAANVKKWRIDGEINNEKQHQA